jgi:hypothetical protein
MLLGAIGSDRLAAILRDGARGRMHPRIRVVAGAARGETVAGTATVGCSISPRSRPSRRQPILPLLGRVRYGFRRVRAPSM